MDNIQIQSEKQLKAIESLQTKRRQTITAELGTFKCELKSSFSTQQICKAKAPIIASYLKLHSLLSLLQSYTPDEWVIKGIIASFKPNEDVQSYLSKQKVLCTIKDTGSDLTLCGGAR